MLPQLFSIGQCVSGDVGTKSFVLSFADLGSGDPHPALRMLDGTDADEEGKQKEDRQPMVVHLVSGRLHSMVVEKKSRQLLNLVYWKHHHSNSPSHSIAPMYWKHDTRFKFLV